MPTRLLLLLVALFSSSCLVTSRSYRIEDGRVIAERSTEDGTRVVYRLEADTNGVPQVERTERRSVEIAQLGVRTVPLKRAYAEERNLTPWEGLLVEQVTRDSAAASAGLRSGDIIVSVNGVEVAAREQLQEIMEADVDPRSEISIAIRRRLGPSDYDTPNTVTVTVGARESVETRYETFALPTATGVFHLTGLQVATIEGELAQEIYGEGESKTLVAGVLVGSPAYFAGFRGGDEVVSCDGQPVTSHRDVERAILARCAGADFPASWFDEDRSQVETRSDPLMLQVTGSLGGHTAELEMDRDMAARSGIYIPILYSYQSNIRRTRWSFLKFIFQFGMTYRGSYDISASRAPAKSTYWSFFPLGMFQFESGPKYNKWRLFWLIRFRTER